MSVRLQFTKGHGTGNDFVLLPDAGDTLRVTPDAVAAVCDRRFGVGADGLIRIVERDGRWFMDYHNADGSVGEMCGNGARVFGRYLRDRGLEDRDTFDIGTRGGVRHVALGEEVSVDMGPARFVDTPVTVTTGGRSWPGHAVFVPNPHAVVFVADLDEAGALLEPPMVDSQAFPEGQNVEFVVVEQPGRRARMRVHERGVGETMSCGTGICAVADRVLAAAGIEGPGTVTVDVPGGTCRVERTHTGSLVLSGPVVFVADGELSPELSGMFT
jgi:diaminopimelate epimerase